MFLDGSSNRKCKSPTFTENDLHNCSAPHNMEYEEGGSNENITTELQCKECEDNYELDGDNLC
jgi:hypothetical protein